MEIALIRKHPESGYEMVKTIKLPHPVAEVVLQHHERLDGSGYPHGLKGHGRYYLRHRLLQLQMWWKLFLHASQYRPAKGIEVALKEIEKNRGVLYNATAADTCLKLFRENKFSFKMSTAL